MPNQTHENYSRNEAAVPSSERSFGMVMAVAFGLLTLVNAWHVGRAWPWTGALAALFFVVAILFPAVLKPLNWIWFRFGLFLHKLINPIVMALIFFGTVVPIGLIMRVMGKDPLRLKFQPDADSYWIDRQPPGPPAESMREQF